MKLPILAYGHPLLRQPCTNISKEYPELEKLVAAMWETMHYANGCGLSAPQIGHAIRLFIVDSQTTYSNLAPADRHGYFAEGDTGIQQTFINAHIVQRSAEHWEDEEGCLSIPGLSRKIRRPWSITITYYDLQFRQHRQTFSGATARMIQHEYDHTEGMLYIDYLKPLARKLMESKLARVAKGQVRAKYPMKFV
jgi:peptide deformylase